MTARVKEYLAQNAFSICLGTLALAVFYSAMTMRIFIWKVLFNYPLMAESHQALQSASMLLGDLDHHYYAYGPLFLYVLAFLFGAYAIGSGRSVDEFCQQIFFDHGEHFLIMRVLGLVVLSSTAFVVFYKGRPHFGTGASAIAAILCLMPMTDLFLEWYAKIDVMLPLWHILAIFSFIAISKNNRTSDHLYAGIFVGLAIATKPLVGASIIPVAFLAKAMTAHPLLPPTASWRIKIGVAAKSLFDSKLLFAIAACLATLSIAFPYLFVNFDEFINSNFTAVGKELKSHVHSGLHIDNYLPIIGAPLLILIGAGAAYIALKGNQRQRLLLAFPTLYLALLSQIPATGNFYILLIPSLMLIVGIFTDEVILRPLGKRTWLRLAVIATMIWTVGGFKQNQRKGDTDHYSVRLATQWIERRIPPGSKLCYLDKYHRGPRIIDHDAFRNASLSDFFAFNRGDNEKFRNAYNAAHANVVASKKRPTYHIIHHSTSFMPPKELIAAVDRCIDDGAQFVIGHYPPLEILQRDSITVLRQWAGISIAIVQPGAAQRVGYRARRDQR